MVCILGQQIGFALSLAGIAGFIVAVGITADSFVVYFERLKDEIKEGRSPRVGRRPGLGPRPAHDPVRRHGVVPRRGHPVLRLGRRGPRLRLHARPVDAARRRGRLPVHAADGVAAVALPVVLRAAAPPGSTARTAASRSRPSRPPPGAPAPLPRRPDDGASPRRLYRGETEFPLIRKRKTFYADLRSALVSDRAAEHARPGLQPRRGVQGRRRPSSSPPTGARVEQAREAVRGRRASPTSIAQELGRPGDRGQGHPRPDRAARAGGRSTGCCRRSPRRFGIEDPEQINPSTVGPAWGHQVTSKALQGLAVFLVAVIIYISLRFEPKMAVGRDRRRCVHDLRPHRGHLLADAVRGHPVDGHRPAHHPGLLALRHRRRLRQGRGEHPRARRQQPRTTYSEAANLARQPDLHALDQHLAHRAAAGRRACCSSAPACSASARSRTSRWRCSSGSRPAPTPRSSSPRRWWPTSRSASRSTRR